MLLVYGAYLYASFQGPAQAATHAPSADHGGPRWSVRLAIGMLAFSAIATAILAEILVSAIEPTIEETGISEVFIGLIVVPLVGNIAEHLAAVRIAYGGNIDFAMGIAFNSALQVALAVSALAVFAGLLLGNEVTLVFTVLEVALLFAATILAEAIASNGRSTWLEGVQLLSIYIIAAIVFWYT
jgi:Ca2+:H+ antiporter